MTIKPFNNELLSFQEIKKRSDYILEILEESLLLNNFVRLEIDIKKTDLLSWVGSNSAPSGFYFRERSNNEIEIAGSGELISIKEDSSVDKDELFLSIERQLEELPKTVRFYGGVSFFNQIKEENWEPFGNIHFFVPKIELIHSRNKYTFAINILSDNFVRSDIESEFDLIIHSQDILNNSRKEIKNISGNPDYEGWVKNINLYLDKIDEGIISKIVASRCMKISFAEKMNPWGILKSLREHSEKCTVFLFNFDKEFFFLGATPEMLFERSGKNLKTEAVAGTRPADPDRSISEKFAKELLNSDKENREHNNVVSFIKKKLDPLCNSIAVSEKKSLKLSTLQHIYTKIECVLKNGIGDRDILFSLMPTPAVSGNPMEIAMKILKDTESYDRGWYSGAVGFVSKDKTSLWVSIRSGLIKGKDINLYSGAGIVSGSDPEKEWQESELKLKKFKEVITYEH